MGDCEPEPGLELETELKLELQLAHRLELRLTLSVARARRFSSVPTLSFGSRLQLTRWVLPAPDPEATFPSPPHDRIPSSDGQCD